MENKLSNNILLDKEDKFPAGIYGIPHAENIPAEQETIDPVTGLYNKKYGRIAAIRMGTDNGGQLVFSAVIGIINYDTLLKNYGQAFCDALIEEAAVIIRSAFNDKCVIYRSAADEFVAVVLTDSRETAEPVIKKIITDIENIYADSGITIECAAGANIRTGDDHFEILSRKTHLAAETAKRFRSKYTGFVFYDDAENDGYIAHGMGSLHRDAEIKPEKRNSADNSELISFAFKIFEKTADFDAAVNAFMSRVGRVLNMNRILIFDVSHSYYTINIAYQWHSKEMAPIEAKKFSPDKTRFEIIERRMLMNDFLPSDRAAYEKYAVSEKGVVSGAGAAYSFPMFNGEHLIGCTVFELNDIAADEDMLRCLNRLTGIVSAHYTKSKTSRESRAKSEFLSKVSHEIRTPMNVIIGMTQIALSGEGLSAETADCLRKIDRASHYLLSLINDILDMSRIESGKMTVEETYINLDELLDGIDTMIRVQTDMKNIFLKVDRDIPRPHLMGDPLKLNQILINIMGNAVKFTSKGGITLSISESPVYSAGKTDVTFKITDTGIGISEESIDKIFNSFEQADEKIARKYGGTGLGLSISSSLVGLLGGKLQVKSKLGEGTEFFFTIPMKITVPAENKEPVSSAEIDFSAKRLLIAEDDELNREIIGTLLGKQNIAAELAENGKEALEMFERSEPGYYDAILMDIRMPVMDGLEASKKIRELSRPDSKLVPILAMTANAFDEDAQHSAECGMNGHLTKPIDMNKVMEALVRVLS